MSRKTIFFCIALIVIPCLMTAQTNLFRNGRISVSTSENTATYLTDGKYDRESTWISGFESGVPHTVDIDLDWYSAVDSVVIYTGIPADQMTASESHQAAGYWCMKNFILQYWDDANWTDISETYTTENRSDRISFRFETPVKSYRFRLVSSDGEPIRISEIEGYGVPDTNMPAPERLAGASMPVAGTSVISATVFPETDGISMKYVGYNQGYFVPGSNVAAWWEYSGVNSARIWADLNTYVRASWFEDEPRAGTLEEFEIMKSRLRSEPLTHLKLDKIRERADMVIPSTNTMSLTYALDIMKRLDVDVLIQSGFSDYSLTWENKWDLWERFYNLSFYLAREAGVGMYAMKNEPNHRHAGPMPLDSWIELMRVVSDAIHCAVEDVNRIYGKNIDARFVGPVTAGTNTNWWSAIAAADGVDYRGEKTDGNLIDIFSTHSYNLPAKGYTGRVSMIDSILRANDPGKMSRPIVFTEIGRWMNAYLIDKEETMDSPSLFTEWAGIYAQNMKEGCYGMWAFKFGNTASSTYPRGIKSGHHYMWKGNRFAEDSFENFALKAKIEVSGVPEMSGNINDGDKSDTSSWICASESPKHVILRLDKDTALGGIGIYSGSEGGEFTAPDRVRSLKVEYLSENGWTAMEKASDNNSKYAQVYYTFEEPIRTNAVRVVFDDPGEVKIREILLFGENTLSSAEKCHDVAGAQRTAEVVRLFAKGFKGGRPLLKTSLSEDNPVIDFCVSKDGKTGNVHVWLVNRGKSPVEMNIDFSKLGILDGTDVIYEKVDGGSYGEASLLKVSDDGILDMEVPEQSVGLLTMNPGQASSESIPAANAVCVRGGDFASKKQPTDRLLIGMDHGDLSSNYVTYITFDAAGTCGADRIALGVHGHAEGNGPYRYHVYCFDGETFRKMTWDDAPYLHDTESRAESVGADCFIAGEMAMGQQPGYHYLDVTDVVKNHVDGKVTFILVRELREPGDTYDKGRTVEISSPKSDNPPVLIVW